MVTEWNEKKIGVIIIIAIISIGFNVFQWIKYSQIKEVVGFGQYNLFCQYNAIDKTLTDGQGTTFNCDQHGNLILKN